MKFHSVALEEIEINLVAKRIEGLGVIDLLPHSYHKHYGYLKNIRKFSSKSKAIVVWMNWN